MRSKRFRGFTLIELLIVVAIIGILAAIAIPNLLSAIERARQKRTMTDMRTIASAWEARQTDVSRYNAAGIVPGIDKPADVKDLATQLQPTYIRNMPQMDGWGQPYFCFTDEDFGGGTPATEYAIISGGRDKILSNPSDFGATKYFDCDIIFSNGTFLSYPDGIQLQ